MIIAKFLTDDLEWQVQRELVNNYFRNKEKDIILESQIKHVELKKAYEQSIFIASIMVEAGASGKAKL